VAQIVETDGGQIVFIRQLPPILCFPWPDDSVVLAQHVPLVEHGANSSGEDHAGFVPARPAQVTFAVLPNLVGPQGCDRELREWESPAAALGFVFQEGQLALLLTKLFHTLKRVASNF
jgi:hypothetical protein